MSRAFLLVLDSFGIGAAADAEQFGDSGADTLGHIAEWCNANPRGPLVLPNMTALGLANAAKACTGKVPAGLNANANISGQWGYAIEQSRGKDTPSGHWEIAGVPVMFEWGYFPRQVPAVPKSFTEPLIAEAGLPGILGNKHASGTDILDELGAEHLRTSKPILYTSADSVIQIAAHEKGFGLQRLYDLCQIARKLADPLNIGRVIARPFLGDSVETFERTANRRDFSVPPPSPTLLDKLSESGHSVISIGKIGDIFAHLGTGEIIKAAGNEALFDTTLRAVDALSDGGLIFTNFVDFDMLYGHRRDIEGYARALEAFDKRLPELQAKLKPGDMVILTADHGCDPSWPGTDHTRECVPVLAYGPGVAAEEIGKRESFSDIGQTIARHLGIAPLDHGKAWT